MQGSTMAHSQDLKTYRFNFKAKTGEFLGIWFVNQLLKLITLGFYSPWAKVRTQQYFYGNTELAGGHFQFLANPWVLFSSYLIAVILLALFVSSDYLFDGGGSVNYIYIGMVAIYLAITPIFLVMMMSFRLRYSAWRGIAFKFNKDFKGAYRIYLLPAIIVGLLVGSIIAPFYLAVSSATELLWSIAGPGPNSVDFELELIHFIPACLFSLLFLAFLPYFDFINSRFLARNSSFGTANVCYLANVRDYYIIYSKWLIATLIVALIWIVVIYLMRSSETEFLAHSDARFWILAVMIVITILYYFIGMAYLKSKRYNLLMGKLEIGDGHRICANTTFLSYFWLMTSNGMIMVMSLGLLRAWVMVRTARYFLNATSLQTNGSLDDFVAAQKEEVNAFAEEVVDTFDLEFG